MYRKIFFLIATLTVSINLVSSEEYINLIVDKLMKSSMANFGPEIEPLVLEEKGYEFKTKVTVVTTSAIAKLYNTTLSGLSSMRRSSNASLETVDDTFTQLSFSVAFDELRFSSSGKISLLGLGGHRTVDARIRDVTGKVVISYNMARDAVSVGTFSLDSLDSLTIKTSGGFRVLDGLTNIVIRSVLPVAKKSIKLAAEYALTKVMNAAVADNANLKRFLG